ncbi:uncharacterized protein CG5098 isoform X2 [Eupeodes corollae]|uniref:uncharacterized protein CG5098 isoform X2 n=1 Tax=Eupeodes corollae TaxID=290404 RepID=UPI00248F568B|nr:uncharacterized protein CG5098 isoform X2 [Eupeodes corollae]
MSGNNPHGHLSQPQNSSWNPLQIPSYIPRQPQLAHMSNERPMVRSPLAWHNPTPPESLYNFISANHKNLEQLNPLLPSFVRGPSPFDSMDLSLQSNRNSSSPLTKGLSASVPPEFGHKPPPLPSHSQNNFPIHNLSTNSNAHHSQSMSAAPPPPPLPKYMNTNGNDVEMQQQACGLFIRDTERINDEYAKITNRSCESDIQTNMTKPVELVKEPTYTNLSNKLMQSSPKKLSPPSSHQQQLLQHQQQQLHHQQHQPQHHQQQQQHQQQQLQQQQLQQQQQQHQQQQLQQLQQQQHQQQQHQQHQQQQHQQQQHQQQQHQHQQQQQQLQQHQHQQQQHQQQQLQLQLQQQFSCLTNGPASPDNNRLNHLANFSAPQNHMVTAAEPASVGTCLPPKCGTDLTTATATENSCNSVSTNDSPANVTSNEDSVDSSGSRTRRKRKPNKTIRVSHDSETDENISLGEQVTKQDEKTTPPLPAIAEISNSNGSLSLKPESVQVQELPKEETCFSNNRILEEPPQVPDAPQSPSPPPPTVEIKQPVIAETIDLRSSTESDDALHPPCEVANNSLMHRSDSDDVETIDKIAEMIAKSGNSGTSRTISFDEPIGSCSNGSTKKDTPSSPVVINDDDEETNKSPLYVRQGPRTPDTIADPPSVDRTSCKATSDLKSIFETSSPSSPVEIMENPTPLPPLPPPLAQIAQPPPPPPQVSPRPLSPRPPSPPPVTFAVADKLEEKEEPIPMEVEVSKETQLSPKNKADCAKSTFEEVEYKLEEMFAGIEDEPQTVNAPPIDDTANSEVATDLSLALALPTPTKTTLKEDEDDDDDSEHKPLSSIASTSNATQKRQHSTPKNEPGPAKKRVRLTKKSSNKKNKGKPNTSSATTSKTSNAQGSKSKNSVNAGNSSKAIATKVEDSQPVPMLAEPKLKGPYILVKPDGSINVINAPIAEDDAEKVSKVKKGSNSHADRSKIRGIHMSTLGNKYDAETADATWMCVFCKKGPHKFGLGDLFGPYIITTKCEDFNSAERGENENEFVSRRKKCEMFQKTPYSLPVVPSAHSNESNNKKKKKVFDQQSSSLTEKSPEERFFGMSKVSETSYEVWMHEDCSIWAPGVFLIGARIVGLESAVWSSTNYTCTVCSQKGAMICCLHRGCGEKSHIPCARLSSWDLNERDFKTYCEKHAQIEIETASSS